MITADIQLTAGFNRGLAALIHDAGLNAQTVVAKETGELIKTLVRLSPKADPKKIKSDIKTRFAIYGRESDHELITGPRHRFEGQGEVRWYAAYPSALYGVKAEADLRRASVDDLKKLMYSRTKTGRIRGRRGRQAVYITQRILTKASTVAKLAAAKARNRGRLAAGWLVAVARGPIRLSGGRIPEFINRHASGARGNFADGLGNRKYPNFTIINTAKGVGKKTVNEMVKTAVAIRAKAMQANALLFMRGKKNLADYAR